MLYDSFQSRILPQTGLSIRKGHRPLYVGSERRAAAFSTFACTQASVPVKIHACVCKGLNVPTCEQGRVCFLRCVFRKGTVKRDDWRHPHYTHTHTYTQVCWQVNVVGYLGNREVIQRNCICFWNSLTCNYTGRERDSHQPPSTHTQDSNFNSRQANGK